MTDPVIISRVQSIFMNSYIQGIKSIKWMPNSVWVDLEIPGGYTVPQNLIAAKITGEFTCVDWYTLYSAISNKMNRVFSENGNEFIVEYVNTDASITKASFYNVRITGVGQDDVVTDEPDKAIFRVKFVATAVVLEQLDA